jgi:DNA-binding MarR family transcriptional regulator
MEMDKNTFWNYFTYISRYMKSYTACKLREFGIGSGQSNILRFLIHAGDGISHEEICDKLELNMTTVSRALQKLKENGYIEEVKGEKDNRIKKIYLTEKAKKLGQFIESTKNDLVGILFIGVGDSELETFINILKKIYQNVKKEENRKEKIHE